MPALVKSKSMCHLAVMPISRGKAVQEGAVGRPEGPQTLWFSQRKRPPPTSWTWELTQAREAWSLIKDSRAIQSKLLGMIEKQGKELGSAELDQARQARLDKLNTILNIGIRGGWRYRWR